MIKSKLFNTNMRAHALTLCYSMNEHGLTKMANNTSATNPTAFAEEKDISGSWRGGSHTANKT